VQTFVFLQTFLSLQKENREMKAIQILNNIGQSLILNYGGVLRSRNNDLRFTFQNDSRYDISVIILFKKHYFNKKWRVGTADCPPQNISIKKSLSNQLLGRILTSKDCRYHLFGIIYSSNNSFCECKSRFCKFQALKLRRSKPSYFMYVSKWYIIFSEF